MFGFELTCSASATFSGTGGSQTRMAITGSASVDYSVTAYPITLTLGGTTPDSSGNQNILVGQQCTASLSGIPSDCTVSNFRWNVSGTTFESWSPTTPANSQASYYNPGPIPATNSTSWYWNDLSNTIETISCTVTVTPPNGEGSPFDLTVTAPQPIKVVVPPFTFNDYQGAVAVATNQQDGTTLKASGTSTKYPYGEAWIGQVQTPALFGSGGYWYYCQLITPGRFHTYNSGAVACTQNGIQGLDLQTPCMADPTDPFSSRTPGWLADNTQHHDGDSPQTPVSDANLGIAKSINVNELFLCH